VLRGTFDSLGLSGPAAAAAAFETEQPDALVVVGELRDALPSDRGKKLQVLTGVTGAVAATIMDLHGIKPQLVLLLKKHNVRKTTSGKIARAWNRRALWDLAENKTEGPWHRSKKAIVFAAPFVEDVSSHDTSAPAASGAGASSARAEGRTAGAGIMATRGNLQKLNKAGTPPHDLTSRSDAVGTVALDLMRWELAKILDVEPSKIPQHAGLAAMGLESSQLARFRGVLRLDYGVRRISEEGMYAGGLTLHWIARELDSLRSDGDVVNAPDEPDTTGALRSTP